MMSDHKIHYYFTGSDILNLCTSLTEFDSDLEVDMIIIFRDINSMRISRQNSN